MSMSKGITHLIATALVAGYVPIALPHYLRAQEASTTSPTQSTSTVPTTTPEIISLPPNTPSSEPTSVEKKGITLRTALAPGVKLRLKNLLENVTSRIGAGATRLERIAVRLESRIQKERERGNNTESATRSLTAAREEVARARTALLHISDADIDAIVDDVVPHTRFLILKEKVESAQGHVLIAHQALVQSVAELRGAQSIMPLVGTSTVASTTPREEDIP